MEFDSPIEFESEIKPSLKYSPIINALIKRSNKTWDIENQLVMIWNILCHEFNIAVCEQCELEWFHDRTVLKGTGEIIHGDKKGICIFGHAYCEYCLQNNPHLFENLGEDEYNQAMNKLARWLQVFHKTGSIWWKDCLPRMMKA